MLAMTMDSVDCKLSELCLETTVVSPTRLIPQLKETVRGVMQATMSGYQDSDDGMLLVTVCEDGGSAGIPYDCAYMNEASTSIHGAYS